jgi:molybdopterin synthase catalytic subunit
MSKVSQALVTSDRIDSAKYQALVADAGAGAIVTFSGDVRNHDQGKPVTSLEYEAHPDAQQILRKVAEEVADQYEIFQVALAHRIGLIPLGETAFLVCASAAHRQDAFAACQQIVDEVKIQIPIWKHQIFADGTDQWVNFA